MEKHKLINGWTKETVMAQVKKYNNGTKATKEWQRVCQYLTDKGNRCAIGCFIPDGHKALKSEVPASALVNKYNYPELAHLMPFQGDSLDAFQRAHDWASSHASVWGAIEEFLNDDVE
jgi:hypothetical protein